MDDIATQYRIITEGAGWIERTDRGRLRFEGADRVPFLHALLTNDVSGLEPGAGTLALYLTPQGRTIADLHLSILPDAVLADAPGAIVGKLATALDALVFAEDVRVTDVSDAIRQISIAGPRARAAVGDLASAAERVLAELPVWSHVALPHGIIVRSDEFGVESWDVLVENVEMARVLATLERHGAVHAPDAVFESLRVQAGRPRFGMDFTQETIPLEAGLLERAISRTKGCYVGQEVIIRVLDRGAGRVARRLVRLSVAPGSHEPAIGARILVDGRDVGHLTSVAWAPGSGSTNALGYVARDVADPERAVTLSWEHHTATARITGYAG